jgi:hypothetical protein
MPRAREETISCEFLTDILQPLQVTQSFLGKLGWRASPQRKRNDGKKKSQGRMQLSLQAQGKYLSLSILKSSYTCLEENHRGKPVELLS